MWKPTLTDWPDDDTPVAVWESDRLYVAKMHGDLWYECSTYGDVYMSSRTGAMICDPEKWAHLPAPPVKLKRKQPTE